MIVVKNKIPGRVIEFDEQIVLVISAAEFEAIKACLEIGQQCDEPDLASTISGLLRDIGREA